MKIMVLMRHSEAEQKGENKKDIDRKLTRHGIKIAEIQAQSLQNFIQALDMILSSHAARSYETAKEVAKIFEFENPIIQDSFLYLNFTTQDFIQWVSQKANSLNNILVVGHNPEISNLAYHLSNGTTGALQPGSIAVFEFPIDFWHELEIGKEAKVTFLSSI